VPPPQQQQQQQQLTRSIQDSRVLRYKRPEYKKHTSGQPTR
jgi:hypothetical protein